MTGIYKIQSKIKPERCYIGSSVDIKKRWAKHLHELKLKLHHSKKLQNHYNKYGKDDLLFSIITTCGNEFLISNEQFFIDSYKPYFNGCLIAGSPQVKSHSQETKDKISLANKGLKRSDEFKEKMRVIMKTRPISSETIIKYKKRSKGESNSNSKIVLNIETGIFYLCCKDACNSYGKNIDYSYFAQMLKGTNPNKTNYIYV